MTSATDNRTTELREKLNKLIIEIERLDIKLDSPAYDMTLGEYEQEREKLLDEFEQAIAATLGNRPTKSGRGYYTDRDGEGTHIMCDDCGGYIGTAEEIAATLVSGTCKNIAPEYLDFLCSECGFVHYHSDENDSGDGNDWAFCPRCGKKVVGE